MNAARLGAILILGSVTTVCGAQPTTARAATGRLQLTFTERSPLSAEVEIRRRLNDQNAEFPRGGGPVRIFKYELANESFDVFVPPTYNARDAYGVFVWMGVTEISPQWLDVFARRKLIYICPKHRTEDPIPKGLWLDGVHNLKKRYNIDDTRIYISGFSAGANEAAYMAMHFPDVLRGALLMMGGNLYDVRQFENGTYAVMELPWGWNGDLPKIKRDMRLVFIRGEGDQRGFLPEQARAQCDALLLDGFERVSLLVIPRGGHVQPDALSFARGLDALEHAKPRQPPITAPTTDANPNASQLAMAKRLLGAGQWFLHHKMQKEAAPYLKRVVEEYPTTPSAIRARELLSTSDAATTKPR